MQCILMHMHRRAHRGGTTGVLALVKTHLNVPLLQRNPFPAPHWLVLQESYSVQITHGLNTINTSSAYCCNTFPSRVAQRQYIQPGKSQNTI